MFSGAGVYHGWTMAHLKSPSPAASLSVGLKREHAFRPTLTLRGLKNAHT